VKVNLFAYIFGLLFLSPVYGQDRSQNVYVSLSQKLLEANLKRENAQEFIDAYANIDLDKLEDGLNTNEKQLAFWINTYNAFIQYQLLAKPERFDDRSSFYKAELINIGGQMFSFDLIEHGIIRNSRVKLGLGYLKKWTCSDVEKQFRLKGKDGRVHFALNCGAISCPPVAVYNDATIDQQLDQVIRFYLPTVTSQKESTVTTSPLFSWFRGDFGGTSGIKNFLKQYDIVDVADMDLEYGPYDWTLDLDNIFK